VRSRFLPFLALALVFSAAGCNAIGGKPTLTDAQAVIADLKLPSGGTPADLVVTGAFDPPDPSYRAGDRIALTVTVNRDAWVAVLRVLRGGATTIVFPNRALPDARVTANAPLHIPAVVAEKPGVELYAFIAATNGNSWLFTRKPEGSAEFVELGATTRALAHDIGVSLKGSPAGTAAASSIAVRVGG